MSTPQILTINTNSGHAMVKEFEILPLLKENDPRLRTPSEPFVFGKLGGKFSLLENPMYLASSLFETMIHNKGMGLAAPQCGIMLQVIMVGADRETKQVMFNPMIIQESLEKAVKEEGCLSWPHLYVKLPRSEAIRVTFQDVNGVRQAADYTGLTARVIQHEIEHLRGHVYWENVGKTSLLMARDRRKKIIKKTQRTT